MKYWLYNACPGFAGRFCYYGTRVYFPPGAMLFRAICQQGSFEPEIVDRLVRMARPHTTIVDVGANIGLMAVPVLRSQPTCHVVSFEPSPNWLPYLRRTATESVYRHRWTVVGKGLSVESGELDFVVGRPQDSAYEGFKSERISTRRIVRVPVSTLDAEWAGLGKPDVSVVKIDVEGAEGLVLQGGAALFTGCHPDIIVEWHEPYLRHFGTSVNQLLSFARNSDYRIYAVPTGVRVHDEQSLRVQMMSCSNFLLLH